MELLFNNIISTLEDIQSVNSEKSEQDVIRYLSSTIIWDIQTAILTGEYYLTDAPKFIDQINTLLLGLNDLLAEKNVVRSWKKVKHKKLIEYCRYLQVQYLPLLNDLVIFTKTNLDNYFKGKDGLQIDFKKFQGFGILEEMTVILEGVIKPEVGGINLYYVFVINLLLAYLDDHLECKEDIINTLKNVSSFLEKNSAGSKKHILTILNDKAKYLEYKIRLRNSRPTKNNENVGHFLDQNFQDNIFEKFAEKTKQHYQSTFNTEELKEQIENFSINEIDKIFLEPFHHLNRFYNKQSEYNINESIDNITHLIEKLNGFLPGISTLQPFDMMAFHSVERLLKNTLFKVQLLKEKKNNFSEIIEEISKFITSGDSERFSALDKYINDLKDIAHHKIPDYYGYLTFIKFLNDLISYLTRYPSLDGFFENTENNSSTYRDKVYKVVDDIHIIYNNCLYLLKTYLRKSKTYRSKPVYLTKKECMLPSYYNEGKSSYDLNVFMDSTYILPLDFDKIDQKIQSWESFLVPQQNHLKDAFDISFNRLEFTSVLKKNEAEFIKKIEENKTNIENQITTNKGEINTQIERNNNAFSKLVKENEFKIVSIVAMFVSIATFVLINVKIFDNKTALESFGIILGLAACFFMFNYFFYIIQIMHFQGPRKALTLFKYSFKYLWLPLLFIGIALSAIIVERDKYNTQIVAINKNLYNDSLLIDALRKENNQLKGDQVVIRIVQDSLLLKKKK